MWVDFVLFGATIKYTNFKRISKRGPFCIKHHSPPSTPGWSHEKPNTHCNVDLVGRILWPNFSTISPLTLLISPARMPLTMICVWLAHASSSDLKCYPLREAWPHELFHTARCEILASHQLICMWFVGVFTDLFMFWLKGGPICLVVSIWPVPPPALRYLLKRWADYLWALPPDA